MPQVKFDPQRIPRKKTVSIIAGFKCYEGIVICADTQETAGTSKRSVPKLRFEPARGPHEGDGLAVAFCGAGDNGAFIDKLVQTAWEDGQLGTSLDEACEEIEKSIKRTYKEFGQIYQVGYCPNADLIYGVKMLGACRLFSARGPVVNEKSEYDSFGTGYYMADFLASRMYAHHLNLRQCAILAAYILFQAKEHVEECGGDNHIAVLREEGVSGVSDWKHVEAMTECLKMADRYVGEVLIDAADIGLESKEFLKKNKNVLEIIDSLRSVQVEDLKQHRSMVLAFTGAKDKEMDFFGLPLPSEPETPEADS
ncbi:MAG TPA: hypothetical protein VKV95_05845 [Terriglobia bacterium]|nr:hypothetical protein [Terriglobia bacterium]